MACEAFPGEDDALVWNWLGGLMTRGLCLPGGLTVEQEAREREGARAAAEDLAEELGGEDRGLEAQVLAAQFVSAHAAAMDCQAEANRRDLPPHARATSQRLARQLMALTPSQVHALCRLRAERRKDREQAARLEAEAARRAQRETAECFKAGAADVRAMAAPPPGTETPGAAPHMPPWPEPVGAGVPEPPPDPAPPLNRRQRRALARLRRRQKRGEGAP